MSDVKDLVRMANQITDFFKGYPDAEAVSEIAGHIRQFWAPEMREKLGRHIAAGGGGLKPLAIEALRAVDAGTSEM